MLLFRPFWCHPHRPIRITLVFFHRISILNLVLFPNQFLSMLFFQIVFPTRVLGVGVRTSFVQEEQQDLQCTPMTSDIYVLEVVSIHPDIPISEFLSSFWASFIFTWVYADIASAACPSQSGSRAITSITFAAVVCDADEPCSVRTA